MRTGAVQRDTKETQIGAKLKIISLRRNETGICDDRMRIMAALTPLIECCAGESH